MVNENSQIEIATAKAVQALICKISTSTANRYIQQARDGLGKPKPKILTMLDFRNYFGL